MIHGLLSGFGLSAATGLSAYAPMLIVGMLARRTDLIHLHAPYDKLTHPVVLIVLAILTLLDFIADKIPVADHILHAVGLIVHPVAGMIVFLAANNAADGINPTVAGACGLALAGGVHGTRALFRPLVTATTGGLGNCVVSLIEDVIAVVLVFLAIIVPVLAFVMILIAALLTARQAGRLRRWVRRKRLRPPPLPINRLPRRWA